MYKVPSNIVRVEATPKRGEGMRDVRGDSVKRQLAADHGIEIGNVRSVVGFLIDSEIDASQVSERVDDIFADPIIEESATDSLHLDNRDLFSEAPPPQSVPSCEQGGVLGVLPGVIGSLQANEAIKIILELGEVLSGRLLIYDAEQMNFETLRFGHNLEREVISDLSLSTAMFDDEAWCMRVTRMGDIDEGETSGFEIMFNSISMNDFVERRNTGWTPFILDVRSESEYQKAHVASSDLQIDHESVLSKIDSIPKEREILVLCRSGMRSQMAAMLLIQAGYEGSSLYNLEGGIMAWQSTAPDEIIHG